MVRQIALLFAGLVAFAVCKLTLGQGQGRIINGIQSIEGKWPFMVSLMFAGEQHFCGGSIINDDTILTATHCAYAWRGQIMDKSDLSIYVGHVDRTTINEEYVFPAKSIEVNKEFASTIQHLDPTDPSKVTFAFNKGHDIAIIKLGRKINFTAPGFKRNVGRVCLASDKAIPIASRCIVMGWGTTTTNQNDPAYGKPSTVLLQANVPIVNWDQCQKRYNYDASQLICAYNLTSHTDSCQGDSGSPFICPHEADPNDYLQFGLVSYGQGCGDGGFYTRVSNWLAWIQERAET